MLCGGQRSGFLFNESRRWQDGAASRQGATMALVLACPVGGAPLCPLGARPDLRAVATSTASARGRASYNGTPAGCRRTGAHIRGKDMTTTTDYEYFDLARRDSF